MKIGDIIQHKDTKTIYKILSSKLNIWGETEFLIKNLKNKRLVYIPVCLLTSCKVISQKINPNFEAYSRKDYEIRGVKYFKDIGHIKNPCLYYIGTKLKHKRSKQIVTISKVSQGKFNNHNDKPYFVEKYGYMNKKDLDNKFLTLE